MRKLEVGMEGSHMDFAVIERFEVLVRDWMEWSDSNPARFLKHVASVHNETVRDFLSGKISRPQAQDYFESFTGCWDARKTKKSLTLVHLMDGLFWGVSKTFTDAYWDIWKNAGIRVCPYCNVTQLDRSCIALDHFLPRSWYPHLIISLNNLILTCTDCNKLGTKWSKEINYNPHDHVWHDKFRFIFPSSKDGEIEIECLDKKMRTNVVVLKYADRYWNDTARNEAIEWHAELLGLMPGAKEFSLQKFFRYLIPSLRTDKQLSNKVKKFLAEYENYLTKQYSKLKIDIKTQLENTAK